VFVVVAPVEEAVPAVVAGVLVGEARQRRDGVVLAANVVDRAGAAFHELEHVDAVAVTRGAHPHAERRRRLAFAVAPPDLYEPELRGGTRRDLPRAWPRRVVLGHTGQSGRRHLSLPVAAVPIATNPTYL